MGSVTVVSAGAGSGKTYEVARYVAERVVAGLDPARVLATTFTKKAAAELKGRIQARILSAPGLAPQSRIQKADRLELAAIGTVHSVGYQILSRFALELGLSPELTVMEEVGGERVLREVLGRIPLDDQAELIHVGRRLEQGNPGVLALSLLREKRSNLLEDEAFSEQLISSANQLCRILSPGAAHPSPKSFDALYRLAGQALTRLERISDETGVTADCRSELRSLMNARRRVWSDFLLAKKMRAGKRSGADSCLDELRAFAAKVRDVEELHGDIRAFARGLAALTRKLEREYEAFKRQRGLLDFTDLEVEFLRLLQDEALRDSLRREFELVVVDEFQDTNPIQLAIFQRLAELARESRWVGDEKQAIYGFRGTDPELMRQVWHSIPKPNRETLGSNYRSQAGLVRVVNRLFTPVFGSQCALKPEHPAEPGGIERWILGCTNKTGDAIALASGVAQLMKEGIKAGEIAVLARTNLDGKGFASILFDLGIPAVMKLPGLFTTRECALVLAGLRLIADRYDSLAAVTILHLLEQQGRRTPSWVNERLRAVYESREKRARGEECPPEKPWPDHPVLQRLARIDHRLNPPTVIVEEAVEALGLSTWLRHWGEPLRRGCHLDNLLALVQQYEGESEQLGLGITLPGLISYLEQAAGQGEDLIVPAAGIDAVTVMTYHGAKGLEWPVVILTGLDFDRRPDLWSPRVSGGSPETGKPLEGREMRFWPWPFGCDSYGRITTGSGLEDDALMTVAGQELRRLDQEESLRLLYVGFTRAKRKLVLAHRPGKWDWLNLIPGVSEFIPADLDPGEYALAGTDTTFLIRHLDGESAEDWIQKPPAETTWLAETAIPPERRVADVLRYDNPSGQEGAEAQIRVTVEDLPGENPFPIGLRTDDYQALGNAIHAYLASLPSLSNLDDGAKSAVAARCLKAFGMESTVGPEAVVRCGTRLDSWVKARYSDCRWYTEVPITAPRRLTPASQPDSHPSEAPTAGQWVGTVDLLLTLRDGSAVIVDHKSAPIPRSLAAAKAKEFSGQLRAYHEIIERLGMRVAELVVHLPMTGVVARSFTQRK
ncbi:MAG: UvrD-helicase domain-containing protein [Acidobacteriota bacterium]